MLVVHAREPVRLAVVTKPVHSIIRQASDCRLRLDQGSVNADGFGLGWYEADKDPSQVSSPCIFQAITPAWSNRNLARLAQKVSSPLIFAHVRAATGASLSEENCHPFNYGALLWMHNGHIANFPKLKRKLQNALNDEIYNFAQGQTDSEWAFALFLQKLSAHADLLAPSFPYDTLKQAMLEVIAQLNAWAREVGVDEPSLLNFAVTDGYSVIATRYISSSTDEAASLYFSTGSSFEETETPGEYRMRKFDKRESVMLIASEPLTFDRADWLEIPCQTLVVITPRMNLLQIPIVDEFFQKSPVSNRSRDYAFNKGFLFSKS